MLERVAVIAAGVLVVAGCASGPRGPGRLGRAPGAAPRAGAHAEFDPAAFELVFRQAVRAVRDRGFALASCDPELGAITTAPVELDAPCHGATCLARETASVKLGFRHARVIVTREVWDAALRGWRAADDPAGAAALARDERALVAAAVRSRPGDAAPWSDPCAPGACGPAGCLVASRDP